MSIKKCTAGQKTFIVKDITSEGNSRLHQQNAPHAGSAKKPETQQTVTTCPAKLTSLSSDSWDKSELFVCPNSGGPTS